METDIEYRSRIATHPDFNQDDPGSLRMAMESTGDQLDMMGAMLTPPCLRSLDGAT